MRRRDDRSACRIALVSCWKLPNRIRAKDAKPGGSRRQRTIASLRLTHSPTKHGQTIISLMEAKKGRKIIFFLEAWDVDGIEILVKHEAEIHHISEDPMGWNETKAIVFIDDEMYGIPLSELTVIELAKGEQLQLF